MRANGVSQLRCARTRRRSPPPRCPASVDELDADGGRSPATRRVMDTPVEKVMGPKLPTIGVGQQVELAVQMLETGAGAARAVRRPAAEPCSPAPTSCRYFEAVAGRATG